MGGVSKPKYTIGLRSLLTLDDIKFDVIALFQSFISVQLNC